MAISIQREIDVLKGIVEGKLEGLDLKVSSMGGPDYPVRVLLPSEDYFREAPAHFIVGKEIRTPRKILWDKVELKPLASISILSNGNLVLEVIGEELIKYTDSIKKEYEIETGKHTAYYTVPEA